jgi:hypothetical protein
MILFMRCCFASSRIASRRIPRILSTSSGGRSSQVAVGGRSERAAVSGY